MQENNKLWLEIKEMFETSQTEVTIFNGAGSDSSKINLLSKNGTPERVKQMLIVATDVVGGIFAINSGKFDEGIGDVWYFAPDTLDWEDLELRYSEFIA